MIRFHKIEGTGNDFIVIDDREAADLDWPALGVRLCDRHHGVGADGLLLVRESVDADLRMRLINADGSEAEMCGNGVRCTAKFALDTGMTERTELAWETLAGVIRTEVTSREGTAASVRVDMGSPRFRPAEVPVRVAGDEVLDRPFDLGGGELRLTCLSMGNPHAVAFVDDVESFPLREVGPLVERHPGFPNRTNFEVVELIDPATARMRVWERGVGETMACGTGACAAAVAGRLVRDAAARMTIHLPGGTLNLAWERGESVFLSGPAVTVYVGEVALAELAVGAGAAAARGG